MRDYDATVKLLILGSAQELLRQLGVGPVAEWLNVELPRVRNRRADLVGRTASAAIIHIEVQNDNDPDMPLRMAEYALSILERHKQYPHQLLLYVGSGKLTMRPLLETHGMSFHYDQLDIRQLDGGKLMESRQILDNIAAVLVKLDDEAGSIRKVVRKIGKIKSRRERDTALATLFSASELRNLEDTVSEEVRKVPIILKTSINNKTFGPWIRKGIRKGVQEGSGSNRSNAAQEAIWCASRRGDQAPGEPDGTRGRTKSRLHSWTRRASEELFPTPPRRR